MMNLNHFMRVKIGCMINLKKTVYEKLIIRKLQLKKLEGKEFNDFHFSYNLIILYK